MARPRFPKSYNAHNTSKTVKKIGQDMRGIVSYKFNNCGFRADADYSETETNAGCYFGHAFTSAVGIEWHNSYVSKSAKQLGVEAYNFSQGCVPLDNNEIIRTAIEVSELETFTPKFFILQFCDLIRRFDNKNGKLTFESDIEKNVSEFIESFKNLETKLNDKGIIWRFFGCDFQEYHPLPDYITKHKNCMMWNPAFFDKILYGMPGEKWHHIMTYGVVNTLKMSSWRDIQKSFVQGDVEFAQDKRIIDFFDDSPVMAIGDTDYFSDKINMKNPEGAKQALVVINDLISDKKFESLLRRIKHMHKVCVAVNKFLIWTNFNNHDVPEDYDKALLDLIKNIFDDRKIKHCYVKGLKGHHFNFASPTTQFFITHEDN